MALSYALSPRGVCRLRSTFYKAELSGVLKDRDRPVLDRDELERPIRATVVLRGRESEGLPPVQKRLLL